jgi:hypothetical protein
MIDFISSSLVIQCTGINQWREILWKPKREMGNVFLKALTISVRKIKCEALIDKICKPYSIFSPICYM